MKALKYSFLLFKNKHKKGGPIFPVLPALVYSYKESIDTYYMIAVGTSSNNPIDIDQEEEVIDIEAIKEQKRNQQIIDQAKLAKQPLYLCLAVIKTTIKGYKRHKNKTLNRAIINFFQQKIGINISLEHFNPKRPDPDYFNDNRINPKEFIIYGVDFLTTPQIRDRFSVFSPKIQEIIWIDSSTCKIKYNTEPQAKKVFESVIADKSNLKFKMEQNGDDLPQGWFSMDSYPLYHFQRQLLIRYSTEQENDLEKKPLEEFDRYESVQGELLPFLFEKFKAFQAYQEIFLEIERERATEISRNNRNNRHRDRDRRDRNNYRSRTRDKMVRNDREQINTSFQFNKDCRRSYEPQGVRMREMREGMEDQSPLDMRKRTRNQYRHNQNPKHNKLGPPMKGNVYYDCNDLDDDLSFDFGQREQQHHSDDEDLELEVNAERPQSMKKNKNLGNLSFLFNSSAHKEKISNQDLSFVLNSSAQKEKSSNQDLSFAFNNSKIQKNYPDLSFVFNSSKIDKNNQDLSYVMNTSKVDNKQDLSFVFNSSKIDKNNQDLSFVMNTSKIDKKDDLSFVFNGSRIQKISQHQKMDTSLVIGGQNSIQDADLSLPRIQKPNNPQEEQDFNILLGIHEDLSSIHQQNQDVNILDQMKEEELQQKPKLMVPKDREETEYPDFQPKSKKKEKKSIFIEDDESQGY